MTFFFQIDFFSAVQKLANKIRVTFFLHTTLNVKSIEIDERKTTNGIYGNFDLRRMRVQLKRSYLHICRSSQRPRTMTMIISPTLSLFSSRIRQSRFITM